MPALPARHPDGAAIDQSAFSIHSDLFPEKTGLIQLTDIHARICYCPADHPFDVFKETAVCGRTLAADTDDVPETCDPVGGTLSIDAVSHECTAPGEYPINYNCALSYDATLDIPKAAGRVTLHLHATQHEFLEHKQCNG
jgi:hypothetical protein